MKITCRTLFDCTYTGVTGSFKPSQVPFRDRAGQHIDSQSQWNRSRNQQRNWETILQIVSLRTQPENIVLPAQHKDHWQFEFTVAGADVFALNNHTDSLAGLKLCCEGVPMIVNLNETQTLQPMLCAHGSDQNIWFESINNGLEH